MSSDGFELRQTARQGISCDSRFLEKPPKESVVFPILRVTLQGLHGKRAAMRMIFIACLLGLAAALTPGCKREDPQAPSAAAPGTGTKEIAVIKTGAGEIVIEFWRDVAPNTVSNFIKLAKSGFYDGTSSHRLIKGFMIQMGDPLTKDAAAADRWGSGGPGYSINAEFNDRKHERGVLSMARSADPNSAGSQFFICFGPAPMLDRQYTAFGRVIKGEEVLARLEETPCGPGNPGEMSRPQQRVGVESIRIVPADSIK